MKHLNSKEIIATLICMHKQTPSFQKGIFPSMGRKPYGKGKGPPKSAT